MNLRWLVFDQFPPELGLTRQERAQAARLANLHRKREPRYRGAHKMFLFAFLPFAALGIALMLAAIFRVLGSPGFWPVVYVVIYPALAWALYRSRLPFVRRALRDMGYELCEECGYWLRGLGDKAANCPECGAARRPMGLRSLGVGQ